MEKVLIAALIIGGIGLIAGALLAIISSICDKGEENERLAAIRDALPGANCGACGFAGCDAYAEAIDKGEAEPNLCAPGGADAAKGIAKALGVEVNVEPKVARVLCNGCNTNVETKYNHLGLNSCRAASLLSGGPKNCSYGCIGFGDCVDACPFGAISVVEGLAEVDESLCTGCGACKKACPKNIITVVPKNKGAAVVCSNHDKGVAAKKVCKTSCIGCTLCVKTCSFGAITMENFLAVIDPAKCTACGECVKKCPQKAITL